jgi:hypothetical protein
MLLNRIIFSLNLPPPSVLFPPPESPCVFCREAALLCGCNCRTADASAVVRVRLRRVYEIFSHDATKISHVFPFFF